MIMQVADFAKYPADIFGKAILFLIVVAVPYGFISYLPAVYLFDKAPWGWVAWLVPLAAFWCCLVARWLFYRGLRGYEGAGS